MHVFVPLRRVNPIALTSEMLDVDFQPRGRTANQSHSREISSTPMRNAEPPPIVLLHAIRSAIDFDGARRASPIQDLAPTAQTMTLNRGTGSLAADGDVKSTVQRS